MVKGGVDASSTGPRNGRGVIRIWTARWGSLTWWRSAQHYARPAGDGVFQGDFNLRLEDRFFGICDAAQLWRACQRNRSRGCERRAFAACRKPEGVVRIVVGTMWDASKARVS